MEKLRISKIEQKLTRLEERDRAKRRYEPRVDYSQIQQFKCNEMGHFANKCKEFNKKNRRNNNQRSNNNRRVNMMEELYNEMYGSSDDESSDDEIDNEEIYAYKMYMKRKVEDIKDDSDMELEEEEMNKQRNKRSNEKQIRPMEKYEYKERIYNRPQKLNGKGWQWSHKNKKWFNSLQGLDQWRARGSPRREI
jgi:hypothetical protein